VGKNGAFVSVGHSNINALTLHIALRLCLLCLAIKNNVPVA